MSNDPRIEKILEQIVLFANSDFGARTNFSEKGDEVDAIIIGLNTLGEELETKEMYFRENEKRITAIMQQLLKITQFNFSERMPVSERGDEMDAIAVGLNTISEEIDSYIHELKDREEQIETIIINGPDAVIVIDYEGKIVRWNPKAEIIFGWKAHEVKGKHLHEICIPEKFREAHQQGMKHFMKTGEGPVLNKPIELPALRKDGSEFQAELSISPFLFKGKYFFVGFVKDITDRKKAEVQLKQFSDELKRSNTELEQFAYIASHDLQEPLRMVSSFVQLLEKRYKDKLDADANDFIHFAVDGTQRMRLLINSLLEYSRANRIKPFEEIKTNSLLLKVLQDLKDLVKENNANIKIDKLPDFKGDMVLISQLFLNLIANAIKFKGKKPPEIHISGKKQKGEILFSVKDNGIGIKKEYWEKIFIIFQRLHGKEKFPGTGIGLAVCRKIVDRHRGKIGVESEEGKGSTFYFTVKEYL